MKKVVITILIIVLVVPGISLAQETFEENFMTANSYEISKEDTLEITIDLSKIPYEEFVFILNSNLDLSNIYITDEVEAEINENELEININKSEMNLSTITLSYKLPDTLEIGTQIEFIGRVEEKDTEEHEENIINICIVEEKDNEEDMEETENEEHEEMEDNREEGSFLDRNDIGENNLKENSEGFNQDRTMQEQETSRSKTESVNVVSFNSKSSNGETQSVTYNGESNNYLSSLTIDGFDLAPSFSKTCQTYFVEVGNDVNSITINAEAEDENTKVTVYGNENLVEGENKVLVSVTAENGTVKFYRIYVTKNA